MSRAKTLRLFALLVKSELNDKIEQSPESIPVKRREEPAFRPWEETMGLEKLRLLRIEELYVEGSPRLERWMRDAMGEHRTEGR